MARKALQVGFPTTLANHLKKLMGFPAPDLATSVDGQWVRLSGGDLARPVLARIDEQDDGRFAITGLLIAGSDRDEVTWSDLRSIHPAALVTEIFRGFDPDRPRMIDDAGDPDIASVLWMSSRPGGTPRTTARPATSARARVAEDLERFAEVYRQNRARTPHRAMAATAGQLGISRATAIRRAKECRERGLLPPRERA